MRESDATGHIRAREVTLVGTLWGVLAASWLAPILMQGVSGPWFSDSAAYLLLADHWRGASTLPLAWIDQYASQSRFPPGFPLLLAATGAGSEDVTRAVWLTTLLSVLAVALAAAWFARRHGRASASLLAAPLLLCPWFFVQRLEIVSEPLYLVLLAGAMLMLAGGERQRRAQLAGMLLLALLPLVRMAGMAVVAAYALCRVRSEGRRGIAPSLAVAAPGVALMLWSLVHARGDSYVEQMVQDPMGVRGNGALAFVADQASATFLALARCFDLAGGVLGIVAATLLLLAMLPGAWLALRRNDFAGTAALASLATCVVWPFPAELPRLLVAALPLLLALAADALAIAPSFARRVGGWRAAVIALPLLALSVPALARIVRRELAPVPAALAPYRTAPSYWLVADDEWAHALLELHARLAAATRSVREYVGPGDCVYSAFPLLLRLQAGVEVRQVPYDLESVADARVRLSGCRYIMLSYSTSLQYGQDYLYPSSYVQPWVEPMFVSRFSFRGESVAAAVLARRKDPANTP